MGFPNVTLYFFLTAFLSSSQGEASVFGKFMALCSGGFGSNEVSVLERAEKSWGDLDLAKVLIQLQLIPKHHLRVEGVTYTFSDPFQVGDHISYIGIVETSTAKTVQKFYRSQSQDWYRLYYPGKDGIYKGPFEESVNLPLEVNFFLERLERNGVAVPKFLFSNPRRLANHSFAKWTTSEEYDAFRELNNGFDQSNSIRLSHGSLLLGLSEGRLTAREPGTLPTFSEDVVLKLPQRVVIQDSGMAPDFSSLARGADLDSRLSGPLQTFNVSSLNRELLYFFAVDKLNHAAILVIEDKRATINKLGLRSRGFNERELTLGFKEYALQMPRQFGGSGDYDYIDTWSYRRELPIIQEFYRARGLRVPD